MLSGNDFTFGPVSNSPAVHLLRLPIDDAWPAAPQQRDSVADLLSRTWRETRVRMQRAIDGMESQIVVVNTTGEIVAVNRAWRMTAKMQGMEHPKFGVGLNYLNICGAAAAAGNQDAATTAEGVEGVMQGRCRSFFYKYRIVEAREQRLYALLAWRVTDNGDSYAVVSHELLETHSLD